MNGHWTIFAAALLALCLGCQGSLPLRSGAPQPKQAKAQSPKPLAAPPSHLPPGAGAKPAHQMIPVVEPEPSAPPTSMGALPDAPLPPEPETVEVAELPQMPGPGTDLTTYYALPANERRVKPGELELMAINTGERRRVKLYDKNGNQRSSSLSKITRVCRDHRKNRKRNINRRLATILYMVGQAYGRPIHVISGYRVRKASKKRKKKRKKRRKGRRSGSRHGSAEAADIRVPGVPIRDLAHFIRSNFERVGVGYYPTSDFVHIDVRDMPYYWIDYSGPGQKQQLTALPIEPKPKPGSDWTVRSTRLPKALRPKR